MSTNLQQPVNAAAQITQITVGKFKLSPGIIYTPYTPLIFDEIVDRCVQCGSEGPYVLYDDIRDIILCKSCMKTMQITEWLFQGKLHEVFPEPNPREDCDSGIVWRISSETKIWPIYTRSYNGHDEYYVPKVPVSLDREYFCHDLMVYNAMTAVANHPGGYGLSRGQELYMYQLHKIHHDGVGWVIGFILDGKHLLAHDVETNDDQFE